MGKTGYSYWVWYVTDGPSPIENYREDAPNYVLGV